MGAALLDSGMVDDDDLIGVADRAQPMGDHDGGPPARKLFERTLDMPFALVVECTGRLVKDQNLRILEENPRNRNPLFLPAGEARPA